MKKIFMGLGFALMVILFPLFGIWWGVHEKSYTKFAEWCVYGCDYEDSDVHKAFQKIKNKS